MQVYQNLALQYRPTSFNEFIYNDHIVSILKSILVSNNIPSGLLFSGQRGIGKTTLSRIMARALNCFNRQPDGNPCNKCQSCIDSLNGNHPDIIEISGSTHGNIDDIRKLIEQTNLTPMTSNYKIFIIDEAQGLGVSRSSWDALLKVIEEPPPYVCWMFLTTQISKIPETIKSRLLSIDLKMIPTEVISNYLYSLLSNTPKTTKSALLDVCSIVARAARHSLRDSLTLLEKVIPYCTEKGWTTAASLEAVGSFDQSNIVDLLNCIVAHDSSCMWRVILNLIESGIDPELIFNEALIEIVNGLMSIALGATPDRSELYIAALQKIGKPRLLYISDIILKRTQQFNEAKDKGFVLRLICMEMCA